MTFGVLTFNTNMERTRCLYIMVSGHWHLTTDQKVGGSNPFGHREVLLIYVGNGSSPPRDKGGA